MDERIQKAKNKLLELGYQDNKYLADYLELIERNLTTARNSYKTQGHHIIPTKEFADGNQHYKVKGNNYSWHKTINIAELDEANFRVNLLYADHLCAHNLLSLCRNLSEIQQNFENYQYERKFKSSLTNTKTNIKMPKYITEDKILEKLRYYTNLYEHAPDERTAHKYRTNIAQWKSKYKQFLENPDKYDPANKPAPAKKRTKNEQCHLNAEKKRALRLAADTAHIKYKELKLQYDKSDQAVIQAGDTWRAAVAEYKEFCAECSAKSKET